MYRRSLRDVPDEIAAKLREWEDFGPREQAMQAELASITTLLRESKARPVIEGAAVEAIRREELRSLEAQLDDALRPPVLVKYESWIGADGLSLRRHNTSAKPAVTVFYKRVRSTSQTAWSARRIRR